ncbi:MAG: hypothetical protein ABSF14_21115 [Terriglobia bacterium]|jgi:hypothetical protein
MNRNEAYDAIEKALRSTGLKIVHDPVTGEIASYEDGYISINVGPVSFPPCDCDDCVLLRYGMKRVKTETARQRRRGLDNCTVNEVKDLQTLKDEVARLEKETANHDR